MYPSVRVQNTLTPNVKTRISEIRVRISSCACQAKELHAYAPRDDPDPVLGVGLPARPGSADRPITLRLCFNTMTVRVPERCARFIVWTTTACLPPHDG